MAEQRTFAVGQRVEFRRFGRHHSSHHVGTVIAATPHSVTLRVENYESYVTMKFRLLDGYTVGYSGDRWGFRLCGY